MRTPHRITSPSLTGWRKVSLLAFAGMAPRFRSSSNLRVAIMFWLVFAPLILRKSRFFCSGIWIRSGDRVKANAGRLILKDGKMFGPGALDMRGGLTLLLALSHYLSEHFSLLNRPVTLLLNSDEETGSHTSRSLIESEARKSDIVLVLEPCLPGGAVKTFRKGVGTFTLVVTGVSAHAGVNYFKGVSAIEEMAHHVLQISKLSNLRTRNHSECRSHSRRIPFQCHCGSR